MRRGGGPCFPVSWLDISRRINRRTNHGAAGVVEDPVLLPGRADVFGAVFFLEALGEVGEEEGVVVVSAFLAVERDGLLA